MEMTLREKQQAYADAINILFNGAIPVEPEQVNEEVMKLVDAMIADITKCSQKIASFGFDVIYKLTTDTALGMFIPTLFIKLGTSAAIKALLKKWVLKLSSGYQFIGCLNTARANYRSKIQIELLGL